MIDSVIISGGFSAKNLNLDSSVDYFLSEASLPAHIHYLVRFFLFVFWFVFF